MDWIQVPLELTLYILTLYVFWLIIKFVFTLIKSAYDDKLN